MAAILSRPQWVNPSRAGNTYMYTQHCGHWCPGAKTPAHQNPLEIYCIGLISCRNVVTCIMNNTHKWNNIFFNKDHMVWTIKKFWNFWLGSLFLVLLFSQNGAKISVWYKTKFGSQNFGFQLWCLYIYIYIYNAFKLIVLSMSTNEFTEVANTIGCKISQCIVC